MSFLSLLLVHVQSEPRMFEFAAEPSVPLKPGEPMLEDDRGIPR